MKDEMHKKKFYIWRLAAFLHQQGMKMSGEELADHLNRNNFLTSYRTEYSGGRGIYTLIHQTWTWVNAELGLPEESEKVATSFAKPEGSYAYQ